MERKKMTRLAEIKNRAFDKKCEVYPCSDINYLLDLIERMKPHVHSPTLIIDDELVKGYRQIEKELS